MTALEDLYQPYKPKRRTRQHCQGETQPLADLILQQARQTRPWKNSLRRFSRKTYGNG
jgi:transcriptional accessory protein Tex/SPT6